VSSGAYRKSWSHFSQACGINDGVSLQKYIVIAVSLRNKIDLYLKDDSDFKKKSLEFIIQDADLSWNTRLNHNISVESEIEFINNFFLKNRRDSEDRDISASFFLTYILIKS